MANLARLPLLIAAFSLFASFAQPACAKPNVAALQAKYQALSATYSAENPAWRPAAPASGSILFIAPDEYSPAPAIDDAPSAARTKYAAELFELAREAADAGQLSLAFQWATETLREDPNHAEARRVLGYEQRDGQWLTAYGIRMLDAGKTWDAHRGWVSASDSKLSGANEKSDAARHADIKNGWQVRTDHFLVTTNHSLAAGAELAAQLERLYQVWRQLFAGFYLHRERGSWPVCWRSRRPPAGPPVPGLLPSRPQ